MYPALTAPVEGRTNWKVFGAVMGGGLAAIGAMTGLVMNGMIAVAANIPTGFTVSADSIDGSNFSLAPPDNSEHAGAKVVMDGQLTNMKITKQLDLSKVGLGTWKITITAGPEGNPVNATGMTVYATSLSGGTTDFQKGLTMDASTGGMTADSIHMDKANLDVPYLDTKYITLPKMSLSIQPANSGSGG